MQFSRYYFASLGVIGLGLNHVDNSGVGDADDSKKPEDEVTLMLASPPLGRWGVEGTLGTSV